MRALLPNRLLAKSWPFLLWATACNTDTLLVLKTVDPASHFAYAVFKENPTATTALDTSNTCGRPFAGDLAAWPTLDADPRWPAVTSGMAPAPLTAGQSLGFPVKPAMQGKLVRVEVTMASEGDELRWCGCIQLPTSGFLEVLVGGSYLAPPERCGFFDRQTVDNLAKNGADCSEDADCDSGFCGCGANDCSARHCANERHVCKYSDGDSGAVLGDVLDGVADPEHCASCRAGSCPRENGTACGSDASCRATCECLDATCSDEAGRKCGDHDCGTCGYLDEHSGGCGVLEDGVTVAGRCAGDNRCHQGTCQGPALGQPCTGSPTDCDASSTCVCADETCATRLCGPQSCPCQYDMDGNGCDLPLAPGANDPDHCVNDGFGCFARACKKKDGIICAADLECGSGHCECSDADCTTELKRCGPVACACQFNSDADNRCDGPVTAGLDDAHDTCGTLACNGNGGCYLPLGASCTDKAQCESGQCECVDERCGDSRCTPQPCDCKFDANHDGTCEGAILAGHDDARLSCGVGDSGAELHCDGAGACRLDLGKGCAEDLQCESNSCASGVCCNELCSGTCLTCALASGLGIGYCQSEPSLCTGNCAECNLLSGSCVPDGSACSGDCAHCEQGADAHEFACTPKLADCGGEDCKSCLGGGTSWSCQFDANAGSRDCLPVTDVCVAVGVCKTPNGLACTANGQCASNVCECANAACSSLKCVEQSCPACRYNIDATGPCDEYVAQGAADQTWPCSYACDGHGGCTYSPGFACVPGTAWHCPSNICECGSNGCATTVCGSTSCPACGYLNATWDACLPATHDSHGALCIGSGDACVGGVMGVTACKKANGQLCDADSQCASGVCACGDATCQLGAMRCADARVTCGYIDTLGTTRAGNLGTGLDDPSGNACVGTDRSCYGGFCKWEAAAACPGSPSMPCASGTCTALGYCCGSTPCAIDIAAGMSSSCAVTNGGSLRCWGANDFGQLGNGDSGIGKLELSPVAVGGLTNPTAVTVGGVAACARLSDQTAWCWGSDSFGQLGNGAPLADSAVPVQVLTPFTAAVVAAGTSHTCGIRPNGTAQCWGKNGKSQLGDGTTTQSPSPVSVLSFGAGKSICGGLEFGCASTTGGLVYCWGDNSFAQLAIAPPGGTRTSATQVAGLSSIVAVDCGQGFACALGTGGDVQCWGDDTYGQIGTGLGPPTPPNPQTAPAFVLDGSGAPLSGVALIAAGGFHACALKQDGTVWCWGQGTAGQLGNGWTQSPVPLPVALPSGRRAATLAAGHQHTCAATRDGAVYCWGGNPYGQLGNASTADSDAPVLVGPWP